MKWVVALVVLAVLVVGYGGAKTLQDVRAKRWAWSAVGLVLTISVPTTLAIFAQLLAEYLRHGR
jgi:NhaP-type Na+/H+ or K+/H+ antiporter